MVLGYEFPNNHDGIFDSNWLIIDGAVQHGGLHWRFREPSLLVDEGIRLLSWLVEVGDGEAQPEAPDTTHRIWPDLYFTEPNLAFSVGSRTGPLVELRVHLSLESGPPVQDAKDRLDIYQYFVNLQMDTDAVKKAAEDWSIELEPFPVRGTG